MGIYKWREIENHSPKKMTIPPTLQHLLILTQVKTSRYRRNCNIIKAKALKQPKTLKIPFSPFSSLLLLNPSLSLFWGSSILYQTPWPYVEPLDILVRRHRIIKIFFCPLRWYCIFHFLFFFLYFLVTSDFIRTLFGQFLF